MPNLTLQAFRRHFEKREEPPKVNRDGPWSLDDVLIRWSDHKDDGWTIGDSVQGVEIWGEPGSGKTSGSGRTISRRYLQAGYGGLVLCFKTDESDNWRRWLKEAGREQDGVFFSVDGPLRFNPFDCEAKTGGEGFEDNLVRLISDIGEVIQRGDEGGKEPFFRSARDTMIGQAVRLLVMAEQEIRLHDIYRIVQDAPEDPNQVKNAEWQQNSAVFALLGKADKVTKNRSKWKVLKDYWLHEFPRITPVTRSGITANVSTLLFPMAFSKVGELFSSGTNVRPEAAFAGKVIVIDVPVAEYREAGHFAALLWSLMFQRAVERREPIDDKARPVFLWEDEAQYFCNPAKPRFLTTCRSKRASVVMLSQTVSNFYDAYGHKGKHKADIIMGLPSTKLFHLSGDCETNEWASKVIARDVSYRFNVASNGDGSNRHQVSISEHDDFSCPPQEFMGLKNGGRRNNLIVEGILFQSGRLWKGRERWIVRKFRQQ
jgi:hypothetical protein